MKIVLATDGSDYSNRAAEFLACLNLSPDDEVTVFHALYWIPFLYDKESYFGTLKEMKEEVAPRIIDSALNILRPVKAKLSTVILDGSPEQCITDMAAESDADIVVMGARGIKGIRSLFVGSVTDSVVLNSSKPVLVVKAPVCRGPGGIKVLFATDGSDQAMATAELLSSVPFPDTAGMTIVHVVLPVPLDIPETFVPGINERILEIVERNRSLEESRSRRVLDEALGLLGRKYRDIRVLSKVGDPSEEILESAAALKADLIAVGCRGLRGIKRRIGSVSRNILAHSTCSALIGKRCRD